MINLEINKNIGRNCLWDSREVLAAPSLEMFQAGLDRAWSNLE